MSVRTQINLKGDKMSTRVKYLVEKLQSESLKDDQRDRLQAELDCLLQRM